jgi:hypothetical protein
MSRNPLIPPVAVIAEPAQRDLDGRAMVAHGRGRPFRRLRRLQGHQRLAADAVDDAACEALIAVAR